MWNYWGVSAWPVSHAAGTTVYFFTWWMMHLCFTEQFTAIKMIKIVADFFMTTNKIKSGESVTTDKLSLCGRPRLNWRLQRLNRSFTMASCILIIFNVYCKQTYQPNCTGKHKMHMHLCVYMCVNSIELCVARPCVVSATYRGRDFAYWKIDYIRNRRRVCNRISLSKHPQYPSLQK